MIQNDVNTSIIQHFQAITLDEMDQRLSAWRFTSTIASITYQVSEAPLWIVLILSIDQGLDNPVA